MPFDAAALYVLLAVIPDAKHVLAVVKLRLLTPICILLPCVNKALNDSIVLPWDVNVAVQLPLTLLELELPPPHAISATANAHNTARLKFLIPPLREK